MDDTGFELSNGHKAFLQAFLANGTLTVPQARKTLAAIHNAENGPRSDVQAVQAEEISDEMLKMYMDVVSQAASLFDYEIRSIAHQVTRERIFALVNTTSDPQTQLATTYTPDELSFIKRILEAMFDKYNTPRMEVLAITGMQATKFARPKQRQSLPDAEEGQTQDGPRDRGLKHSEVDRVMKSLVGGGWFETSSTGFFSLTPRALLELRPWLIDMFNDPDADPNEWQRVKFCGACKEIVTVGLRCSEPNCTLRLHDICQEAFWRSRRSTTCPLCSREWTGDLYVGERAVTMTEAYERARQRSGGHSTGSRRQSERGTAAEEVVRRAGLEDGNSGGEESGGDES